MPDIVQIGKQWHDGWCLEILKVEGSHPYYVRVTSPRKGGQSFDTEKFSSALPALAYAVSRIDTGDWK